MSKCLYEFLLPTLSFRAHLEERFQLYKNYNYSPQIRLFTEFLLHHKHLPDRAPSVNTSKFTALIVSWRPPVSSSLSVTCTRNLTLCQRHGFFYYYLLYLKELIKLFWQMMCWRDEQEGFTQTLTLREKVEH